MELRGLFLLTVLACGVRADDVKFSECKKFPAGISATPMTGGTFKVTAVSNDKRSAEVTLMLGDAKTFVITPVDSAGAIAMGEFTVDEASKTAAKEMMCGNMNKNGVVNMDPPGTATKITVKWMAKPDYKGKVMFEALGIHNATTTYNSTTAANDFEPAKDSNAPHAEDKDKDKKKDSKAAAAGLSAWMVMVAMGVIVVCGHRLSEAVN
ncbi:uncharacterized protein [Dermacentor albipictus]|uniref:uncharacterized protein n=1 Tax=Dermacentor albipictus TaxID=60249 RepID=UPI0038FCCBD9